MNIFVVTEDPMSFQVEAAKRLVYCSHGSGWSFLCIGFEGDAESALSEVFALDCQGCANRHVIIVADGIKHLWQGARELLDMVVEVSDTWSCSWLIGLLAGGGEEGVARVSCERGRDGR